MTIRFIHSIIIILICGVFFGLRSCNSYYDSLSGKNIRIGIANVYDSHTSKGGTYYHYIYQVGKNYYTETVRSGYVADLSKFPVQSFILVYNKKRPHENVLISEKRLRMTFNLDTIINQNMDLGNLIKKNTLQNDNATSADRNDPDEKRNYFKKADKLARKSIWE